MIARVLGPGTRYYASFMRERSAPGQSHHRRSFYGHDLRNPRRFMRLGGDYMAIKAIAHAEKTTNVTTQQGSRVTHSPFLPSRHQELCLRYATGRDTAPLKQRHAMVIFDE